MGAEERRTFAPSKTRSEAQRSCLRVSCQYLNRLLGKKGNTFHAAQSKPPFRRYTPDLTPARVRFVCHIQNLRAQVLRALALQRNLSEGELVCRNI